MKDQFGRKRNKNKEEQNQVEKKKIQRPGSQENKKNTAAIDNNFKKREIGREKQIRRDDDNDIDSPSISLEDVDEVIQYQFDENFNFHVEQNNRSVQVPTIYNTRERWEWAKRNKDLRTVHDKVIFPLIVYERTDVSRDTDRENANTINQRVYGQGSGSSFIASTRYSKKNRYSKFATLNGSLPKRQFYTVSVPNYVEVEYDFQIFTEYMYQLNEIIEQISYVGLEYWGDPNNNLFRAKIGGLSTSIEIENEVRFAKADFSVTLKAYLLPEHVADSATTKKAYTVSDVEFEEKIVSEDELDI